VADFAFVLLSTVAISVFVFGFFFVFVFGLSVDLAKSHPEEKKWKWWRNFGIVLWIIATAYQFYTASKGNPWINDSL
jgi:hypothetical protein